MRAFPAFFLTFLVPGFIKECYKSFIYDQAGIGFVAIDAANGNMLEVVVGPLVPDGYFKWLLKRKWFIFYMANRYVCDFN